MEEKCAVSICSNSTPYGHDVYFEDRYNLFSSNNPFYESYTTNTNDKRVCHQYYYGSSWVPQHTEKKDWLKEGMKDRYVGVSVDDTNNLCGMSEAAPGKTVGYAEESSMVQLSSTITLLGGRHVSEGETINVGEKKISVVEKAKTVSVIGTSSLSMSSSSSKLEEVCRLSTNHLGMNFEKINCNSSTSYSSYSVMWLAETGNFSFIEHTKRKMRGH
ncbi:uncharacterized protein MONOS_9265 [Monocercomonoides exilis]|uniref:uncharacterized protein n=1 Tax=Monocercomonoides exilis TaxID=2049356 RepID=UPI00355A9AEC|nr:hypothetical protein MONOS_9265 [Monocercomonoides exilis]|eukprot:MONOS_9265.1-p1 / transcript=MONOS_9265.1 / gene=MONOS_9265 / organism=Monocercomonoides_exilis_PA203 / gene_product=unspecified product / transcript_product=unspecified product / location=Mono_scaffold00376:2596-3389(-) / protein_length=216 / sequence_SO=supercontig / SO=protein_coding / is_pseudo=false